MKIEHKYHLKTAPNSMTINVITEMREQFTLCDIDPNTIIFLTRMTQAWCIKN